MAGDAGTPVESRRRLIGRELFAGSH